MDKKKKPKQSPTMHIRIPAELFAQMGEIAKLNRWERPTLVVAAIEEYVAKYGKQVSA